MRLFRSVRDVGVCICVCDRQTKSGEEVVYLPETASHREDHNRYWTVDWELVGKDCIVM